MKANNICNTPKYFTRLQEINALLQSWLYVKFSTCHWARDRLIVSLMLLLTGIFLMGLKLFFQHKQDPPEDNNGSFLNENNNIVKYFYWRSSKSLAFYLNFKNLQFVLVFSNGICFHPYIYCYILLFS